MIKHKTIYNVYIKYDISPNEHLSLFQYIGDHYCYSHHYSLAFIACYIIGGSIGFFVFGMICDLKGRKKSMFIQCCGTIICMIPLCVLGNFAIKDHYVLYIILWCISLLFVGFFIAGCESSVYVYFMEINPRVDFFKSINGLIYERYIFTLVIFYIMNQYVKNLLYFFYFFEVYMVVFIIVLMRVFPESPRYFSERNDVNNKKKSIEYFSNKDVVLRQSIKTVKEVKQQQHNKYNFNLQMITNAFKHETNKIKNKHIIILCFICLTLITYILMISMIFDLCKPYSTVSTSTKNGILIYLVLLFPLLQLPSIFIYETTKLEKFIMFLMFVLACIAFIYDIGVLREDITKIDYYGTESMVDMKETFPYIQATSLWLSVFAFSIYELMILIIPYDLYRCIFYFRLKSISHLFVIVAFLTVYMLNTPLILVSFIALACGLLFSVAKIMPKNYIFEEYNSINNGDTNKQK